MVGENTDQRQTVKDSLFTIYCSCFQATDKINTSNLALATNIKQTTFTKS